ncbi:Hypothetical predicted protein [Olea europaea subsp. europaea]|uniref:Uncharacterized protein n=1 Tax=Olea europaea subsp. europaea TaxID=158383 RepID=A0A8S0TPZ8_OLEEU|nr:Hypothetical predicted protein [Olea europaea subsp. europaea]
MAIKIPHLFYPVLCLFLFLILFHEGYTVKDLNNASSYHHLIHRKALITGRKFDFRPFLKRLRHRKPAPDLHQHPDTLENEIDPRYGVEKRLVPTGPNPLHH